MACGPESIYSSINKTLLNWNPRQLDSLLWIKGGVQFRGVSPYMFLMIEQNDEYVLCEIPSNTVVWLNRENYDI